MTTNPNELNKNWLRLHNEALAAWHAQRDAIDEVYSDARLFNGPEPSDDERELIETLTRMAVLSDEAARVAYQDWQDALKCQHEWVTLTTGSQYFAGGELVEDLHDVQVCRTCGQEMED